MRHFEIVGIWEDCKARAEELNYTIEFEGANKIWVNLIDKKDNYVTCFDDVRILQAFLTGIAEGI